MNQTEQLISEILQIKEQYEAQVTGQYKQWPRAIKDRVVALAAADVRMTAIAKRTGISYHTLMSWRDKSSKRAFRELAVVASPSRKVVAVAKKSVTVTNPRKSRVVTATEKSIAVTIRTHDGLTISVASVPSAIALLRGLRSRSGAGGV